MSAEIFDGKVFADKILKDLAPRVTRLKKKSGRTPRLAILYFKGFAAAESFVKAKAKACEKIGITPVLLKLDAACRENQAISLIQRIVKTPSVVAVSLIKPFPKRFDFEKLEALIPWGKDAEGVTPFHYGRLFAIRDLNDIRNKRMIVPATAGAIAEILQKKPFSWSEKKAVVIGRSHILGIPAARLLTAMDLTVTLCHSKTKNLAKEVCQADVLVSGIGRPGLIRASWLKRGAVIIDAGMTSVQGKLTGDVDLKAALKIASFITPVLGGVGPVTTAVLLRNVVFLAEQRARVYPNSPIS